MNEPPVCGAGVPLALFAGRTREYVRDYARGDRIHDVDVVSGPITGVELLDAHLRHYKV